MAGARLLAFNPTTGEFKEFIQNTLQDFYDHLECDCFDIAYRKVGKEGRCFDIFVDDIGLFREKPIVSAIGSDFQPQLVGNLIFANHDLEGNTTSLSDEEIIYIKDCLMSVTDPKNGEYWYAITPVDYSR